jgi:hypothetical protein
MRVLVVCVFVSFRSHYVGTGECDVLHPSGGNAVALPLTDGGSLDAKETRYRCGPAQSLDDRFRVHAPIIGMPTSAAQ